MMIIMNNALLQPAAAAFRRSKNAKRETMSAGFETATTKSVEVNGNRLSTADILLTTCLEWGASVDIELPEAVVAYCARVTRRPAFAEAKRRNDPTIVPPRAAYLSPDASNI